MYNISSKYPGASKRPANLSPEQIALLVKRFKEKNGSNSPARSIPQRPKLDQIPLSFAQQRLWFIDQLDPNSSAYIMPLAFRFNGYLDVAALELAVSEIIRRHDVLRTTFKVVDGQPVQIINPAQRQTIPIIDLSELTTDTRATVARELAAQEARRPFNLRADPMFRALLIRLNEEEHVLMFTLHHIACDGWSLGILHREIGVLYRGYSEGEASPLAELPLQYADFAHWQRNWLHSKDLTQQLAYWKQQLTGVAPLELPTDRPRPPVLSYRGAVETVLLEPSLVESLRELARRQGVTLFMVLLAGFKVLLTRYTGQQDISVGTPIAGRNWTEIEGLIGFFVNALVMRTEVRGDESFEEVLRRVREVALDGYARQDVPFEKLVEEIQPERDASRQPLCQVIFALNADTDRAAAKGSSSQGMALSEFDYDYTTTRYDWELFISDVGNGFLGRLIYNTDLFEATTIRRMLSHFKHLLGSIVSNPKQSVSTLPILSADERQQILHHWNDTARPFPSHLCIHQLFESQVQATPDAPAVIFEDRQFTYAELNERANLLAQRLRRMGVGPEQRVGILMERQPDLIVSILAILKAGGAYLPLDPEYPQERLSFMLADADIRVVITQMHLAETITEEHVKTICVDTDWAFIKPEEGVSNLESTTTPDNLAFILYTSGSTGRPKGVELIHRNVARLVFGVDYSRFEGGPRVLQISSVSFDASTIEIWGALLHGGCLVLYPERVPSFAGIATSVARHDIEFIVLTTSLFHAVVDNAPEALAGVKQVLVGGEAMSASHVRRVLEKLPNLELTNGYGPTESTTIASYQRIGTVREDERAIAIGRPVSNTQVYIMNRWMETVGVGVCGELCIGGDGLARGYMQRPELTAERFVPNPYSAQAGARLYRTGDVCRYREDGTIEYVGRIDGQVKVRGRRIELGEIETAIGAIDGLREVVVVAREDRPGEKRLVAYVVTEAEQNVTEILKQLQVQLPEYMIPSALVELYSLPLTVNGKVDRKRLPAPEVQRIEKVDEPVGPLTEVEQFIRGIWQEVLGVERVGIRENFFDLGGHSLLMVQVHGRLQQTYGEELSMTELFKYPTVSALANYLSLKKIVDEPQPQTIEVSEKLNEGKDRMRQRLQQRQRASVLQEIR